MPNYISTTEAAKHLPGRPHRNTLFRWMNHGLSGVKLRSIRVGAKRFTTEQWCREFIAEVSAQHGADPEHLAAVAELDAAGV